LQPVPLVDCLYGKPYSVSDFVTNTVHGDKFFLIHINFSLSVKAVLTHGPLMFLCKGWSFCDYCIHQIASVV